MLIWTFSFVHFKAVNAYDKFDKGCNDVDDKVKPHFDTYYDSDWLFGRRVRVAFDESSKSSSHKWRSHWENSIIMHGIKKKMINLAQSTEKAKTRATFCEEDTKRINEVADKYEQQVLLVAVPKVYLSI
jgi:hypothetical protein